MTRYKTKKLILSALCLALGLVLPSAFHLIGAGTVFLPMHIPVIICGLLCGWQYGAAVGFILPLLSSVLTGMPPIFPVAPAMMLELCAYGLLCGLFYRHFKWNIYLSLVAAMLGGRVVSGIANTIFMGMAGKPYGFSIFLSGAFVTALPGILLQLIIIPPMVVALQKAKLVNRPSRSGKTEKPAFQNGMD